MTTPSDVCQKTQTCAIARYALALFWVIWTCFTVHAQDTAPPNFADVFPPSPTATSLGRFEDVPVSLYTGTPSISVPLWEIRGKDVRLPISLNYHASGVKVDEVAPPVGLNWALNAGGVVTRVAMGTADDAATGFLANTASVPVQYQAADYDLFEQYADGGKDSQPDIFHFSLPGASGKFVLDYDGTVVLLPTQKVDIKYNKKGVEISQWIITTTDGISYTLDQNERQKNTALDLNSGYAAPTYFYNSSWFLSKIETPHGETITFSYRDYEITYRLQDSETRYTNYFNSGRCGVRPDDQKFKITTLIRGKRLTGIERMLSGETVTFHYEQPRYDLDQDSVLTRVEVKDKTDKTIKEFTLGHRYLSNSTLTTISEGTSPNDLTRRLMLTSVTESGRGSLTKPPYTFEYILENDMGRGLPNRLSFAQDHWGYFNNQLTNETLCPRQIINEFVLGREINIEVSGGIRSPEASSSLAGTLNKVTYPTGGHTLFEYEAHDYYTAVQIEPELKSKGFLYTIASSFETSENQFTISSTAAENKVQVEFRYPEDITINPQTTWMRIDREGAEFPVYYSESYYDSNSKTFGTGVFDPIPGVYTITYQGIDKELLEGASGVYDLEVSWFEVVTPAERGAYPGGGVRIQQTTDYDPVSKNTIVKQYEYLLEDGKSSGSLVQLPEYGYTQEMYVGGNCYSGGQPSIGLIWVRSPSPNYTLGMTQGSYVGYSRVVVTEKGNGNNGYSVYNYTSPASHPDIWDADQWPAAPHETREWQRGLLTEQAQYRTNTTEPISQVDTDHTHYLSGSNINTADQYVQGAKVVSVCVGSCLTDPRGQPFQINFYRISSGYSKVRQTKEMLRSQAGGSLTKQTSYKYSQTHLQPVEVDITDSKNQTRTTAYKYATDFPEGSITYGNHLLRDNHMHSQVLEQTISVGEGDNAVATQKSTTTYDSPNSNIVPILVNNYPTGTNEAVSTNYEYDDQGNVRQVLGQDGVPTAYIWGYNQTLPVAKVVGATYDEAIAKVNFTTLQALNDEALRTELDKLRGLPDVQVTIYIHDPLVGITSETDPSGRITTYHYDDLNRLEWIKSQEGHVVQKFDYQYAQP